MSGTTSAPSRYLVYLTEAEGSTPANTIVNVINWDGVEPLWFPPNQAVGPDTTPPSMDIGGTYTKPS